MWVLDKQQPLYDHKSVDCSSTESWHLTASMSHCNNSSWVPVAFVSPGSAPRTPVKSPAEPPCPSVFQAPLLLSLLPSIKSPISLVKLTPNAFTSLAEVVILFISRILSQFLECQVLWIRQHPSPGLHIVIAESKEGALWTLLANPSQLPFLQYSQFSYHYLLWDEHYPLSRCPLSWLTWVTQAAQDPRSVPYLLHSTQMALYIHFLTPFPTLPHLLRSLGIHCQYWQNFSLFQSLNFFLHLPALKGTWDSFEEELPLKQSQEVAVFLPHPTVK